MKTLLIAYHSQTGNTEKLVGAAFQSATAAGECNVVMKAANTITSTDILSADAYIFASPENFGYMSGELKALFDRTYEECRENTAGKSYALLISCDNDGSGAKASIERILNGYQMKFTGLSVVCKGEITEKVLADAVEIGKHMTVAVASGII